MRVNIDGEQKAVEVFCHADNFSTRIRDPDAGLSDVILTFYDKTGRVLTYLSFEQCVQLRDELTKSIPPSFG